MIKTLEESSATDASVGCFRDQRRISISALKAVREHASGRNEAAFEHLNPVVDRLKEVRLSSFKSAFTIQVSDFLGDRAVGREQCSAGCLCADVRGYFDQDWKVGKGSRGSVPAPQGTPDSSLLQTARVDPPEPLLLAHQPLRREKKRKKKGQLYIK